MMRKYFALAAVLLGCSTFGTAVAEPYFAVREGLKCASCHVNPSGGGMRTAFGNAWAQTKLAARRIEVPGADLWMGEIDRYIRVGSNLRTGYTYTDVPHADAQSEFDTQELRAYLGVSVIPGRLLVYVDQRVAPGAGTNLEAYARYTTDDQRWSVQAGQMYLPYGLRIEDDTAFIRQATGIGFATPDKGVQLGLETGVWSAQLAITNGTAAGPETDHGKQASLRAEHVGSAWRIGAGFNYNDADAGKRQMQGVFAGLRTGPIAWLAEVDSITDDSFAEGRRRERVGLLEGNWGFRAGHNLKLTAEYFEPDTEVDEDEQNRFSLVWEYTPIQFVQVRMGLRVYDGIPQNDLQNRKVCFVGVNGFF